MRDEVVLRPAFSPVTNITMQTVEYHLRPDRLCLRDELGLGFVLADFSGVCGPEFFTEHAPKGCFARHGNVGLDGRLIGR